MQSAAPPPHECSDLARFGRLIGGYPCRAPVAGSHRGRPYCSAHLALHRAAAAKIRRIVAHCVPSVSAFTLRRWYRMAKQCPPSALAAADFRITAALVRSILRSVGRQVR